MNENQIKEFCQLLDLCSEQARKPKKSDELKLLMIELLGDYGFNNIMGAIKAHMLDKENGKFDVTTGHIQEQIAKAIEKDGRPSVDEAWAIAIQLDDEQKTVVTNDEISQAWFEASPAMPDKAGARMAFRAAYNRICEAARREHRKPRWFPSLGIDVAAREPVLQEAVRKGLLMHEHVQRVLPASSIDVQAIEHSAKNHNAQETLKALMQIMKTKPLALKQSDQE
jgi:hypothetical protein